MHTSWSVEVKLEMTLKWKTELSLPCFSSTESAYSWAHGSMAASCQHGNVASSYNGHHSVVCV